MEGSNGIQARLTRAEQDIASLLTRSRDWDGHTTELRYLGEQIKELRKDLASDHVEAMEGVNGLRRWAIGAVVTFAAGAMAAMGVVATLVSG